MVAKGDIIFYRNLYNYKLYIKVTGGHFKNILFDLLFVYLSIWILYRLYNISIMGTKLISDLTLSSYLLIFCLWFVPIFLSINICLWFYPISACLLLFCLWYLTLSSCLLIFCLWFDPIFLSINILSMGFSICILYSPILDTRVYNYRKEILH